MSHEPLGDPSELGAALTHMATTIDARAGTDPESSWTAKLLFCGPQMCAKKLGEEGVEAALAVASQSDVEVAAEAADVLYHLFVALRSRGVTLDQVAERLKSRQGQSGLEEKAGRKS